MAVSGMQTAALSLGMMVSGAANSLLNKAQDRVCVADCDTDKPKLFEQPVLQTLIMFAGECFCLVVLQVLALYRHYRRSSSSSYQKLPTDEQQRSSLDETHFHPERATDPPQAVIAAPPSAIPVTVDPGAEALPQDHYEIRHLEGRQRLLFAMPALCDITGTTLMSAGLIFTPVSVYQMTRSALVLWVGLFSVIYLGRRLSRVELVSLFTVCLGVFIVGLSSASHAPGALPSANAGKVVLGVSLILFAQIFTAAQFVIEEKIMARYSVEPLRAVGLEGISGLVMTLLIMAVTFVLVGRTSAGQGGYFDAPAGFSQVFHSKDLIWTSLACCCSIAFFNFFGLAVTKTVSATARSTIDTCRTALIWLCSLYLGWETFKPLQIVGFALTVYGTMCFNGVVSFPVKLGDEDQSDESSILAGDVNDANKPASRDVDPTEQTALLGSRD